MAQVDTEQSLQAQARTLKNDIRNVETQIRAEHDRVLKENHEQICKMRKDIDNEMAQYERNLDNQYANILDEQMRKEEQTLEKNLSVLAEQYKNVLAKIEREEAEKRKELQDLMKNQENFAATYRKHQELCKNEAERVYESVREQFCSFENEKPVEWFMTGKLQIYSQTLKDIRQRIDDGYYEAAIAIGATMERDIIFDEISLKKELNEWINDYILMRERIEDIAHQLHEVARKLPTNMGYVKCAFNIIDFGLSVDMLNEWSSELKGVDGYSDLINGYSELVNEVSGLPELASDSFSENVVNYMKENYQKSNKFSHRSMYMIENRANALLKKCTATISSIHNLLEIYNQKFELLFNSQSEDPVGLEKVLNENGYCIKNYDEINKTIGGSLSAPLRIEFSDNLEQYYYEICIIPICRLSDNKWVNTVDWYSLNNCSVNAINRVREIISKVVDPISVINRVDKDRDQIINNQSDRMSESRRKFKMMINGRLN